jgi:hypothetical protein
VGWGVGLARGLALALGFLVGTISGSIVFSSTGISTSGWIGVISSSSHGAAAFAFAFGGLLFFFITTGSTDASTDASTDVSSAGRLNLDFVEVSTYASSGVGFDSSSIVVMFDLQDIFRQAMALASSKLGHTWI